MPTETTQNVTITANAAGDFVCVISTNSVQTVTISKQDMIDFITSQDSSGETPPAP